MSGPGSLNFPELDGLLLPIPTTKEFHAATEHIRSATAVRLEASIAAFHARVEYVKECRKENTKRLKEYARSPNDDTFSAVHEARELVLDAFHGLYDDFRTVERRLNACQRDLSAEDATKYLVAPVRQAKANIDAAGTRQAAHPVDERAIHQDYMRWWRERRRTWSESAPLQPISGQREAEMETISRALEPLRSTRRRPGIFKPPGDSKLAQVAIPQAPSPEQPNPPQQQQQPQQPDRPQQRLARSQSPVRDSQSPVQHTSQSRPRGNRF